MNISAPSLIPGVNEKWLRENRRQNRAQYPVIFRRSNQLLTLEDLEAKLIKRTPRGWRYLHGDKLVYGRGRWKADGVTFLCPLCFRNNGGPVGTHIIICWFQHIPLKDKKAGRDISPGPGRWNPSGETLADLTFIPPGSTSVRLLGGCNAHFFVERGRIKNA